MIHEAPGNIFDEIHVALEDHGSPLIVSGDVSMRLHETNQMDQTGHTHRHNAIACDRIAQLARYPGELEERKYHPLHCGNYARCVPSQEESGRNKIPENQQ